MEQIDIEKYKLKPVEIDEKTRGKILLLVLFVLFLLFCLVKDNTQKKSSNSSFGALKDFKIEFTQEEYNLVQKSIEDCLLSDFRTNPETIQELTPREFEEFVAYLYARKGFDVSLTPESKDGGKDIVAKYRMPTGENLIYYIECKHYNPKNPVGVAIVRAFAGAMVNEHVHVGVLVTTSRFTKDAREEVRTKKQPIELKDMNDIINLLV